MVDAPHRFTFCVTGSGLGAQVTSVRINRARTLSLNSRRPRGRLTVGQPNVRSGLSGRCFSVPSVGQIAIRAGKTLSDSSATLGPLGECYLDRVRGSVPPRFPIWVSWIACFRTASHRRMALTCLRCHPFRAKRSRSESSYRTCISYCASSTQRKPKAPERSLLGAIIKSLPCSVNLYAWGKYQIDPCGW